MGEKFILVRCSFSKDSYAYPTDIKGSLFTQVKCWCLELSLSSKGQGLLWSRTHTSLLNTLFYFSLLYFYCFIDIYAFNAMFLVVIIKI